MKFNFKRFIPLIRECLLAWALSNSLNFSYLFVLKKFYSMKFNISIPWGCSQIRGMTVFSEHTVYYRHSSPSSSRIIGWYAVYFSLYVVFLLLFPLPFFPYLSSFSPSQISRQSNAPGSLIRMWRTCWTSSRTRTDRNEIEFHRCRACASVNVSKLSGFGRMSGEGCVTL